MSKAKIQLVLRAETFSGSVPVSTSWLLAECMEFRGKQDLWVKQKPEMLEALRQQAVIQSVESSNRIEGVIVSAERLRPLVIGKARPRDRSEEELSGYRRALEWIFSRRDGLKVDSAVIKKLHALCQQGAGDAGKFKSRDNEIVEVSAQGKRTVRFRPTPAAETAAAIDQLCAGYDALGDEMRLPPLLLVSTFVFDFLCIHPFRDGNGRVARLLMTLLLQQHGFAVGRFISLERLVEESKEDYYAVLHRCSHGWAKGENEILPWWNYALGIVRRAYAEFAQRVTEAGNGAGKSDMVRQAVLAMAGPFSLADMAAQLPGVSLALVKKVMLAMKAEGRLKLVGLGRAARWTLK